MTLYNAAITYNQVGFVYGDYLHVPVAGTTFTTELNRLANLGIYPSYSTYKPPRTAANIWAGTTLLPLVAALNRKNNTVGVGLARVCNALAGTVGLSETDALRTIAS